MKIIFYFISSKQIDTYNVIAKRAIHDKPNCQTNRLTGPELTQNKSVTFVNAAKSARGLRDWRTRRRVASSFSSSMLWIY